MNKSEENFWFPVKAYGWGWGLPVRWQGWVALGVYFLLQYFGIRYFRPERDVQGFLVFVGVITVALIAIVAVKGERPLGWRWGK